MGQSADGERRESLWVESLRMEGLGGKGTDGQRAMQSVAGERD